MHIAWTNTIFVLLIIIVIIKLNNNNNTADVPVCHSPGIHTICDVLCCLFTDTLTQFGPHGNS